MKAYSCHTLRDMYVVTELLHLRLKRFLNVSMTWFPGSRKSVLCLGAAVYRQSLYEAVHHSWVLWELLRTVALPAATYSISTVSNWSHQYLLASTLIATQQLRAASETWPSSQLDMSCADCSSSAVNRAMTAHWPNINHSDTSWWSG